MVRMGKSAGGGVAVRALEGGGVDVVVEVGWWHQVGGVERLLVVVVATMVGVVKAGLVAQGGGRRGGARLLVPAGQGCSGCFLRINVLLANCPAVFLSCFSLWSCYVL